jgi:N-acetylmuramoyl-L-alanine amidase
MTVFASAGHTPEGPKKDPGAVSNGYTEAQLNREFRDLFVKECLTLGLKVIKDKDTESLSQYLNRIQTGSGSVVIEFHFDAAGPTATGVTALIERDADRLDKAFATECAALISSLTGIKNRGVKSEAESHRGSLGLMREEGIICLIELGFITNKKDIELHLKNRELIAKELAKIAKKYDDMIG